ncbi:fumarylacetoacetate hydrolase family protein [Ramlibacter sp. WS9]|uniref:fumarylacetoacetate hydrolase family protein n=1 Tax=Ramlibacter sp. WS9 TaxID=1882741 RepID=UPI0011451AD5|nr:fumarylacetoacetate hydrolase family protein [Ramlibacter sp. WS9]ROZ66044.1 FAA hydrolase family protein [Ramlibacter sp. WS9]
MNNTTHIARYALQGRIHYGIVEGDRLRRLAAPPFEGLVETGDIDPLAQAKLLAPIERPRIFGAAYNYREHTKESGKKEPEAPVIFMKPSTAAVGPGDSIVYPWDGEIVHYEGELCAVMGKTARYVTEADALDYVLGYTCGNDVSDRVVQRRESAFGCLLAGKGYDTFAPIGPHIVTGLDPSKQRVITRVNGAMRQDGSTADLVFSVPFLIAYLSRFMTLLPGDVIMTGTPAGVGLLQPGDTVEVEIPGIGVLSNDVTLESRPGR